MASSDVTSIRNAARRIVREADEAGEIDAGSFTMKEARARIGEWLRFDPGMFRVGVGGVGQG